MNHRERQICQTILNPLYMKKDLDCLIETLEETHPNLFFRLKKSQYKKAKKEMYKEINRRSLSVREFKLILAHFLHQIHDGHTFISIRDFHETRVLPVETQLIQKKLVITKTFQPIKNIKTGDVIVKINNKNTYSYLRGLAKFKSYEVFENCMALLGRSFRYKYLHDIYDNKGKYVSLLIKDKSGKLRKIKLKWRKNTDGLLKKLYQPFKFRFLKDVNAGFIKWDLFFDRRCCFLSKLREEKLNKNKIPNFESFLKEVFKILKEKNAQYLIVDIRENTGGCSYLGNNLISYLINKRIKNYTGYFKLSKLLKKYYSKFIIKSLFKRYSMGKVLNISLLDTTIFSKMIKKLELKKKPQQLYQGKMILLTSYLTYSSAERFAGLIKDNNLGILVGEPTGNGSNGPIDQLVFTLSNSRLKINLSFQFQMRPDMRKRKDKILNPDYFASQSYQDYIDGKDTILEYAKAMIRNLKI